VARVGPIAVIKSEDQTCLKVDRPTPAMTDNKRSRGIRPNGAIVNSAILRWAKKVLTGVAQIKPLVEVVAILVGGWWAYTTFIKTQEPGLKENFRIESTLFFFASTDDKPCIAEDHFTVTNLSKSTVAIRKVWRRAWFVERPNPGSGIIHFDPMAKALGAPPIKPIDDHWYEKEGDPFVQTYPPGASSDYALNWLVEKRPDTYVLVRLDFFADTEAKDLLDFKYDWEPACVNRPPDAPELQRRSN
jgi:hypothetical protein